MTLHNTIASRSRTNFPDTIHRPDRYKQTAGSILALTAGLTLGLSSAAMNACYGFYRYDTLPYSITWAAVSVAASAILAIGPTALLKSIRAKSLAGSIVAAAAIGLTGSYSSTAAIGASAGQRISAQISQDDTDSARSRLQTAYQTAKEELGRLPAVSATTSELEVKIAALRSTPGSNGCEKVDGPVSRRVCPEVAGLEIEKARAARREELQTTMANADDGLKKLGPPETANTDATAISGYLAVAGVRISTEAINRWLALLAVAVVELGGGLAFALSSILREPVMVTTTTRPKDKASTPVPQRVEGPEPVKEAAVKPTLKVVSNRTSQKRNADNAFAGRLLKLVKDRGGEVHAGHRALGKALGCSTAHVGNVLRELSGAGHVIVEATKMGTVIKLAA